MKSLLILAGLLALGMGSAPKPLKTKQVDADFVTRQKKVLSLFGNNYDTVGKDYDIEANVDNYTNKKAVEEFLTLYRMGFVPKDGQFSIFYDRIRDETIALFRLFYYAKDFETFYKTAAFAKLHMNKVQFLYTFYTAVIQRPDTHGIVLPALYEEYPEFFLNWETVARVQRTKMQNGKWEWYNTPHGVVKENDYFVFYSNYSDALTYPNEEVRMSYFMEDVGLNSYYGLFNMHLPFWWNSEKYGVFKERRGEIYYYFYQQLLARYYLERLTNGLGDIPKFSWYAPLKTGYYAPLTTTTLPMAQRPNDYDLHIEQNYEYIRFLDTYEKTFFQFLQEGHFKAFDKEVDLHNAKAVNFVGNYWQTNADLYSEDFVTDYQYSYETIARHVLSGAPEPKDKYAFRPSVLDFYLTTLRDPVSYQLYQRIVDYMIDFKQYLDPYSDKELHFKGVKLNDVKVDKMVTYFDYFSYNVSHSTYFSEDELKTYPLIFVARQPRLNHKPFTLTIDVNSEMAVDAVFKIFIGPKYNSNGFPITLEDDWMKFYELDWFHYKLISGNNVVKRESNEFMFFKDDSVPTEEIFRLLDEEKVPYDMSVRADNMPRRLMLPRGTEGGYPFQLFVFVYPLSETTKEWEMYKEYIPDLKPFGFPLDRPLREVTFKQPNIFFKDVFVYHEGEMFPYKLNTPKYFKEHTSNVVPKH